MQTSLTPYLYGIGANLCWATATLTFSKLARQHSSFWINLLKASVAFVCFFITFLLVEPFVHQPVLGTLALMTSGLVGLCLGDLFLFRAFATLGAARTLVLYAFQPFILGVYGFLFLGQNLNFYQISAIFCMIGCVFVFLLERNRTTGRWDAQHFLYAFIGIIMDAFGIMLTRQSYEMSPSLGSFQANTLRAAGALIGFFVLRPKSYGILLQDMKRMIPKERNTAIGACLIGTYVSLALYLTAIKTAHVATLTAISITGPIWVALIEHVRDREWPNRYLWLAFSLFIAGFAFMTLGL